MALIDVLKDIGHQQGQTGTRVVRSMLYGTRYKTDRPASESPQQVPAIGVAPRSVWNGPMRRRENGAPLVKRERSA